MNRYIHTHIQHVHLSLVCNFNTEFLILIAMLIVRESFNFYGLVPFVMNVVSCRKWEGSWFMEGRVRKRMTRRRKSENSKNRLGSVSTTSQQRCLPCLWHTTSLGLQTLSTSGLVLEIRFGLINRWSKSFRWWWDSARDMIDH